MAHLSDQYGNPIRLQEVVYGWDAGLVDLHPDSSATNWDGDAILRGSARMTPGVGSVTVASAYSDVPALRFDFEITP